MSTGNIYSLTDAQRITGASRHLVTFLINDRQIPVKLVGMAKVIDDNGLKSLRSAITEYKKRTEAAVLATAS